MTSEKLMNGSSLLSSRLFDYLNANIDQESFYKPDLQQIVDTCYGDMTDDQMRRLEFFHAEALKTTDGGASSSPVASFILGNRL